MSIFDGKRLTNEVFKLDIERMRQGWYSDKYFANIEIMLRDLSERRARYEGIHPRLEPPEDLRIGDMQVEMQWFTRRPGATVVVGTDKALEILRHCAGTWEGDSFKPSWEDLQVWAVQDGSMAHYDGDVREVQPVMRVRGRYRDFAILETPTLGILTRASRVATNVYETLVAGAGKPIFFFPARFDLHEVQAADGYAYNIAVQRFNMDFAEELGPLVSTDAQGDWWGGAGGGTIAHAAIACFFGDTAAATLAFAETLSKDIPRIALVDFNNYSVRDSLRTLEAMFQRYRQMVDAGQEMEAERYRLYGVRLDTSGSIRDDGLPPLGDPELDLGVTPRLVISVRQALDAAWESWDLPPQWRSRGREYCRQVKIVASGGFNPEKIRRFERLNVPVDMYGVGSSLFSNSGPTVTDFTADVVKICVDGEWVPMAKVGRVPGSNPELERVH